MDYLSNEEYDKLIDKELERGKRDKDLSNLYTNKYNMMFSAVSSWQDYVAVFEKEYVRASKVSVYVVLGEPEFAKIELLSTARITEELEILRSLLKKNNIIIQTLCPVDDIEMYRFIIEELFYQPVDNYRQEGVISCFTYEDFHPNAKYDIKHACRHFFSRTLSKVRDADHKQYDLLYVDTANYVSASAGGRLSKEQVEFQIYAFLDSFERIEIDAINIISLDIDEGKSFAKLLFSIVYRGIFDQDTPPMIYKGEGRLSLKPSVFGAWDINTIDMPGLSI